MTRTIRRAVIAAVLTAAPLLTIGGPAFAASDSRPAVPGVVVKRSGQPNGRTTTKPSQAPLPRTTRPAPPVTTKPVVTSTPRPAGSTTAPAQPAANDFETQVAVLTNVERAKNGLGALRIDSRLVTSARAHSADMVASDLFSHTGSDGSDFVAREARAGYTTGASAENIAWGYRTPSEVVTGWMNSPGHRANILSPSSIAVGVGVAHAADGSIYWTQNFGRI